jgi:hypothetical protein
MTAATHPRRGVAAVALLLLIVTTLAAPRAHASTWIVTTANSASGLAKSIELQPPDEVTATCTAPLTDRSITVTWNAVSDATSYVVYESTTSATGGFSAVATDLTATSWTSGTLKKETYWYAVAVVVGSSTWISPMSAATAARTIATTPRCS